MTAKTKIVQKLVKRAAEKIKVINPVTFGKARKIKDLVVYYDNDEKTRFTKILFDGERIGEIFCRYQGFNKKTGRHVYYISWFTMTRGKKAKGLGSHSLATYLEKNVKRPARVKLFASAQDSPFSYNQEKLLRFYRNLGFKFNADGYGTLDID